MAKIGKNKGTAPATKTGLPVLSFLYSVLFLGLAGLAGWAFWMDMKAPHGDLISAQTDIHPPQAKSDDHAEPEDQAHKDDGKHSEKKEEHHSPSKTDDDATENKDAHAPAADSHQDPQPKTAHPAANSSEPEHSEIPNAESADEHAKAAEDHSKPSEHPPIQSAEIAAPTAKEHTPAETGKVDAHGEEADQHSKDTADDSDHKQVDPQHAADEPKKPELSDEQVEEVPQEAAEETPPQIITETNNDAPLSAVPDPELTKNSDFGLLPIIGPGGRTAWRSYAKPFEDPLDRPRIAIIMSEMGMSTSATQTVIQNLPGAVTLSFNPYARDLQNWVAQSRAAGHEVLLQLPMEPFGYPANDPGPHSLLTSLTDRENLNRLEWILGRFTGYTGVTNQMGSRFTASAEDITPILDIIKKRGLLFMDGRTSAKSVAGKVAANLDIPVAVNNRFLDHKADRDTIDKRLAELERIARLTGTAIGVGYPYPVTLERISKWAKTLNRKGFVLAPVSAVTNRQEIQ